MEMEQTLKKKRRKIKFICLQCDKVFDRAQRLQDHQNKKSCNTVCTRCNHKFRDRSLLEKHQKNPVYNVCDICDVQFCHLNDYRNHQRTVHGVNPTKCTVCFKEFRNDRELKSHQKNPSYNDCDVCDKRFCSDRDYNSHQIVDHRTNPRKCKNCGKLYKTLSELKKHRLKASSQDCDLCDQKFCNLTDYNRHRIVEHRGGQIEEPEDEEYANILNETIFVTTGREESEGYKELVEENYPLIKDKIEDRIGVMMKVNRELVPGFTYQDLRDQIVEALFEHKKVAKFNVGFGFILWNKLTQVYRFYYVSTNTLLFDKAETISKTSDVKDIVKKIHDMNVQERYYMMRPDSSWVIAGVTNLQFKLMYINLPLG